MIATPEYFDEIQAIERAQEAKRLASEAIRAHRQRVASFARKLSLTATYGAPVRPCAQSVNEPLPGVEVIYPSREDKSYYRIGE